jgi:hypothetical protein
MSQCLGRLVKDAPKGVHVLSFEEGGFFHVPLRCETVTRSGDLCDNCAAKERKTAEKLKTIVGTRLSGTYPSYLFGRVTEPIPYWSRLYDGAWFRLKIQEGYTLSEESMGKIKAAVAKAYEGVEQVPPAPIPGGTAKPGRKAATQGLRANAKKPVAAPVAAEQALEQLPVVPTPTPPVKRRANVKKPTEQQPVAKVEGSVDVSEYEIVQIKVRKQEVDGRMFYLDPKKDKLYDMKFKYVGRLKDGAMVSHPDSDAEV